MSVKHDFDDDEWFLLGSVPAMIGSAMSTAAPSGVVGTIKELSASVKAVLAGKSEHTDSPLIQELLSQAGNREEAKAKLSNYRERTEAHMGGGKISSKEELHALVVADCRAAAALVDERCTAADAAAYKAWSVTIARKVAQAGKEGAFLGFGGVRVSDEERVMIGRIESALGVETGLLIA